MKDLQIILRQALDRAKWLFPSFLVLLVAFLVYGLLHYLFDRLMLFLGVNENVGIGLLKWLLDLGILSHLAGLLAHLFQRGTLSWDRLLAGDFSFFAPLSQVYFWLYLIEYAFFQLLAPNLPGRITLLLLALWQTFTAPAFESVYLAGESGQSFLPALLALWRANPLPMTLFSLVGFAIYYGVLSVSYSWLFQPEPLSLLLIALLSVFYYLTKGILFQILNFTNPRSREFRQRMKR